MSEALRFNTDKPMMSYFMRSFPKMAEAVARVKEMGAIKYDDGNWRLGNKPDREYWDSAFRHLDYIFGGEFYDSDTGCLHIAHAVWNLCALLELNYPDLPARDEAIWADRAAHWAEEKKKRETAKDVEAVEGFGAALVARWAAEGERKRKAKESTATLADSIAYVEAVASSGPELQKELELQKEQKDCEPQGSLEKFIAALEALEAKVSDIFFTECPMCGRRVGKMLPSRQGLECPKCGEIFEVPIVPEGEGFVKPSVDPEMEGFDIELADGWSPSLAEVMTTHFNPSRGDAVDAAAYATYAADFLLSKIDGCPMCGSPAVWQGDCGRECRGCGEIFEVPSGPENEVFEEVVEVPVVHVMTRLAIKDGEAIETLLDIEFGDGLQDSTFYIGLLDEAAEAAEAMKKMRIGDILDLLFGPGIDVPSTPWVVDAECPMCGSDVIQQGACGRECSACGEVFDVPIVPENTEGPKTVRFGTKGERRPMFVNTMAERFEQMRSV